MGKEVLFVCGSDAHGTPIVVNAEAQGLTVVLRKEGVVYGGKDITQDVVKKLSK